MIEEYNRLNLKKIQERIELVILLYIGYIFFPTTGNIFIIFFKFISWILIVYITMYWINKILNMLRVYIEDNYLNWTRNHYETRYNLKYGFYSNNVISNIMLYLINLFVNKKRLVYIIKHYLRYETLYSFLVICFVGIFIGAIVIIFFK